MHAIPRPDIGYAAQSKPLSGLGAVLGGADVQCVKARTDIDDISELIEDAVALSAKARSLVEAIIGYGKGEACGTDDNLTPSGVLRQLGERSRNAREEVASAVEELERLSRSIGL